RHLRALAGLHAREAQLYRQAHHDPLTGLPNRRLFHERLVAQLAARAARGALLYIDLDEFKQVNDSVGHAGGDQLLAIAAQRLRASVAEGDTVARLGGDEFAVILPGVADADAAGVAARIVESLQLPVAIGGREHFVRASVGIALYPAHGLSPEALLHHADTAMFRAKGLGRGRTRRGLRRAAAADGVQQLDFLHEHRSARGEHRAA
ncbi:MAG TPA: GGDEF domain-containing protein, partial [Steroidobacteraceae bacterium]|nr:GGDEF domain-containing protein [Steroidobacteraceae bacterium]